MAAEVARVVGVERVHRILRIPLDVKMARDRHLQIARAMPGLRCRASIDSGQRRKALGHERDVREHQRQPELAGADDAALRASGGDPDRQRALGARRDRRVVEG